MSVEVRMVPANWEHPKDEKGDFIPLYSFDEEEIKEWLREKDEPADYEWGFMPYWPEAERTHYQMYERTTEGTPISPVMETPEDLARWLFDNNIPAFSDRTATYEQWLSTVKRGWAWGMVSSPRTGLVSGVEGQHSE